MINEDEVAGVMKALANGMKRAAPELAAMQKEIFDQLREAGFTEEQAMEILKHGDYNVNSQR